MKQIGGLLALAGIASCVLSFLDMNLKLLMWIDNWGTAAGWGIRAGMIVVGGGLWMMGNRKDTAGSTASN